jgi:hypothetical protein
MNLFGLELGKKQKEGATDASIKPSKPKLDLDIKKQLQELLAQAVRFQVTIIALAVVRRIQI